MSVRSFRPVFMVGGVAAAALSCYLVSLRVASERAALENVETEIVLAQRDIRLLQTEIGTRGRLAQLERWNVKVLALSAPSADQFVPDSFQLASLVAPEHKPAVEAPVVYASAPAEQPASALPPAQEAAEPVRRQTLLHEASLKVPPPASSAKKAMPVKAEAATKPASKLAPVKTVPAPKQAAASKAKAPASDKPQVKMAKADPLAPLPAAKKKSAPAPKSAAAPGTKATTSKDSGKTR